MLKVENLSVGYSAKIPLVSDINFALNGGEIMAVLGANGVGKSTLVKTIAGLLPPLAGSASIDDKSLHTQSQRQRSELVAWMPQDETPTYGFTALENVLLGVSGQSGSFWDSSEDRKRALGALLMVRSEGLANKRMDELSGGERQRVALARCLVQGAKLVILDEPIAQQDPGQQVALREVLKEIAKSGKSILCVLHDLNYALNISDKTTVLHSRMATVLSTSELVQSNLLDEAFAVNFDQVADRAGHLRLLF